MLEKADTDKDEGSVVYQLPAMRFPFVSVLVESVLVENQTDSRHNLIELIISHLQVFLPLIALNKLISVPAKCQLIRNVQSFPRSHHNVSLS